MYIRKLNLIEKRNKKSIIVFISISNYIHLKLGYYFLRKSNLRLKVIYVKEIFT